eukprot:TRINITY_DN881_c0_g1_i1.p1 TRINITY_DN881_c0_g1~~TRINITY_DN881_c0_g1_i1.p1  ORF type:complete len:326 (+),score=42.48 TRINITY_DN881_c0_g1_i1:165-1142(+)
MQIPAKQIALLMGPYGNTLYNIERRTGCKIKMPPRLDAEKLLENRRATQEITIAGTAEDVEECKGEISFVLANGRPKMSSEMGRKTGVKEVAKEIRIPNQVCGMLMGAKGATIKELQDSTGCHVWLDWDDTGTVNSGISTVYLMGTEESVDLAEAEVMRIRKLFGGVGGRGESSLKFEVPEHAARRIIGKGGETIRQLQIDTRCTINVEMSKDRFSIDANQTALVKIIGERDDCHFCKSRIAEILSDVDLSVKRCQSCKKASSEGDIDRTDGFWYCNDCWDTFEDEKADSYHNKRYGRSNAFGVDQSRGKPRGGGKASQNGYNRW